MENQSISKKMSVKIFILPKEQVRKYMPNIHFKKTWIISFRMSTNDIESLNDADLRYACKEAAHELAHEKNGI